MKIQQKFSHSTGTNNGRSTRVERRYSTLSAIRKRYKSRILAGWLANQKK